MKECVQTLFGAEIRSFNYQSGRVEVFGPDSVRNNGNYASYTVTFNFDYTGKDLAFFSSDKSDSWLFGWYTPTGPLGPYIVHIAHDIAAHFGNNDFIVTVATQVHELAHALRYIGGVAGDRAGHEAGDQLEKCVFGGSVQGDGYAY